MSNKFSLRAHELLNVLRACNYITRESTTFPAMATVLLEVTGAEARICASDRTSTAVFTLPISGGSDDFASLRACVDHRSLITWLRNSLHSDYVSIEKVGPKILFKVGSKSRIALTPMDTELFPFIHEPEGDEVAVIGGKSLTSAASKVAAFASGEFKPSLQYVAMKATGENVRFLGTNQYILAYLSLYNKRGGAKGTIYVHGKSMLAMTGAVGDVFEEIRILSNGDKLFFVSRAGDYVYSVIPQQLQYPIDLAMQMIGMDQPNKVLVKKESIIAAFNASRGVVREDKGNAVKITLQKDSREMIVESARTERGGTTANIEVDDYIGEDTVFAADVDNWISAIQQIDNLQVWIHAGGRRDWIHVTGLDNSQRYVLAPIDRPDLH